MKEVTIDEYREHGTEFFEKYKYVQEKLGNDARAEDVLKVMQSLSALVIKKRKDDKPKTGFVANRVSLVEFDEG